MNSIAGYTENKNVQMLISLMLEHGVKRVIVSPGGSHNELVLGLQYNGCFEMYSAVDERGAAYMAVGMAAESGEPIAIVCTESVASRNYYPGITEAYYRQLPILTITGVHGYALIGHLKPQVIDRSISPSDSFGVKVHLSEIKDDDDLWKNNILINKALLELNHHGGKPVHIDLPRTSECERVYYDVKKLPKHRVIRRYLLNDKLPEIKINKKIAVFVGVHNKMSVSLTKKIDSFCSIYNAVVFGSHACGYDGKHKVMANLAALQGKKYSIFRDIDLLVHIGGPTVDVQTQAEIYKSNVKEVWRVNPDGEIRDTFKMLSSVFEMEEEDFFDHYSCADLKDRSDYLFDCNAIVKNIHIPIDKIPFSNIYAAHAITKILPKNSMMFIGGSTTLRAWSMFEFSERISTISNMGTRGIDGVLSSFIGAALVKKNSLCFCVLGDLTFFYDINALGNRDLPHNLRILLVNDGGGCLFKLDSTLREENINAYIAAAGHFGNKSKTLVKGYVESLGFEYMTASSKEEFDRVYPRFVLPELTEKPMFFEIFTNADDERAAFDIMQHIDITVEGMMKQTAKQLLGDNGTRILKKIIRK